MSIFIINRQWSVYFYDVSSAFLAYVSMDPVLKGFLFVYFGKSCDSDYFCRAGMERRLWEWN